MNISQQPCFLLCFNWKSTCIEAAEGHDSTEFGEDLDAGDPERKRELLGTFGGQRAKKMCGSGMDLDFFGWFHECGNFVNLLSV